MNSWEEFFAKEKDQPYFVSLMDKVKQAYAEKVCYPPFNELFNAYKLTPLSSIKVVILGQDPYHNPHEAMGLAFSVNQGIKLPPSLKNIYKEIELEYQEEINQDGDLTYLAKQGVFLLNTCLSVEENKPLSHSNFGYQPLIEHTIETISDNSAPKVFILWGNESKKYLDFIDAQKHLVLMSAHPSPLSASRGFFGNQHFKKTNEYLINHGLTPINWINTNAVKLF